MSSTFDPVPSEAAVRAVSVEVVEAPQGDATVLGILVDKSGDVPAGVGLSRESLKRAGFSGNTGQTLTLPRQDGSTVIAVGVGEPEKVDAAAVRDAAGALARAASHDAAVAVAIGEETSGLDAALVGQAIVEGAVLGRYRYEELRSSSEVTALTAVTIVAASELHEALRTGADRGRSLARATSVARDLSNAPGSLLTAPAFGDLATRIASETGLGIEVLDKAALEELGCGGLLGVNRGSADEPRMIKVSYRPEGATAHLGLVGKGIMYDSGGISLKPSNSSHQQMKMDMTGAGAVLAAMSVMAELGVPVNVTGYLACTDNMPSSHAQKLGDVAVTRSGRTIEVLNTDAEGRLVMVDAIALAVEDEVDAVVDIATLTGACLMALGPLSAGVFANDDGILAQVKAAAETSDESVWHLPLDRRYRKLLDSEIADVKNIGGDSGGAITAALFLAEWAGETPWAHLDIAGPMRWESTEGYRPKGASGFGARLLVELAQGFTKP
ncbi:MAG: leucyl aminopeptidase [Actinomycetales bacterium]|nr:leucyl aminopeptidase [Actinomycetales bacterium]